MLRALASAGALRAPPRAGSARRRRGRRGHGGLVLLLPAAAAALAALLPAPARGAAAAAMGGGGGSVEQQYGRPGETDPEGFDPYADTVGPGVYGGKVKTDAEGNIVVGRQYQDHNKRPGPVYTGGGYTEMAEAIHTGPKAVAALLDAKPELLEDVSTGGARPLHLCGMSRRGQLSTAVLVERGADVEALDTYGYTPLIRMASNDLPVGAEALLEGGADAAFRSSTGETAQGIAEQSRAFEVLRVLHEWDGRTH